MGSAPWSILASRRRELLRLEETPVSGSAFYPPHRREVRKQAINSGRGLSPLWFLALLFLALAVDPLSAEAQSFAYVTARPSSVTVINTSTDNVVATVTVGNDPFGVAITPDGTSAYVANSGSGSVSVIDTTSRMVVATIILGGRPQAIAFTPDGSRAYVTNSAGSPPYVSVIDTSRRAVIATVPVGGSPSAWPLRWMGRQPTW